MRAFTNATFLVKDSYAFDPRRGRVLRLGRGDARPYTDTSSWGYELDERGFARTDPTMQHPRSVFQVMKTFYARYTPEVVANICGCTRRGLREGGRAHHLDRHTRDRAGTIMYALGWTHHSHSVQLIHAAAMLQLLLGNIGRPGGGLNALRGHANIQGGTDCGVAYHNLPGYIADPEGRSRDARRVPDGGDAEAAAAPTSRTSGRTPIASRSASSRRTTARTRRADNDFGYQLHPRLPQSRGGRLRELELGLHLRPHVSRPTWRGSSASA